MPGAEKLHLELDLPYPQFLVDRATADNDYVAEARHQRHPETSRKAIR